MSFVKYIKDSIQELNHVSWPTKRQTIIFTTLVIIISFAVAIYLNFFDFIFSSVIEILIEKIK